MGKRNQVITAIAASFSALLMGCLNVWPSYTLKLFTAANTTVLSRPMTQFEASLVGSAPSLGALLGTAVTGLVIDTLGRKKGVMFLVLPYMINWLIIKFSSSPTSILIARSISGIGGGAYCVYAPIYISEISEPTIRGALASGALTLYCAGMLISYLSGWFFSYSTVIWINIGLCFLNLFLMSIVVESPVFLLKLNNEQQALRALAHYRAGPASSTAVLAELRATRRRLAPAEHLLSEGACEDVLDTHKGHEAEEKLNLNTEVTVEPRKDSAFKSLFAVKSSRKAFIVVGTSLALQVLMGMVSVQVYAGELFSTAAPALSPDLCSVLLALVLFAGCVVSLVLVDKVGRRVLIISSSALVAACMGCLAVLLQTGAGAAWLAALVLLVYCFCFSYGAASVPYVLLAELFTTDVQGVASMVLVEMIWLLNFLLIAVFPYLVSWLGVHGVFYGFAAAAVANALLSHWNIPETKGLSNRQIQELFSK